MLRIAILVSSYKSKARLFVRGKGAGLIHFISGKGGVGKSTVAASLAWSLANQGRRTLLVELGERGYFRHIFKTEIGLHPVQISSHLQVVRYEGEACLREYIQHLLKIERVVNLFFDNKVMRSLVQAAPALRELALLGKITSGERHIGPTMPYDDLVVDAYSTGHFRALWRAPVGMGQAIPIGPMGDQSRSIVSVMKNPEKTRFHVVMIPEELPVTEGLELARDIQAEMDQSPHLILNRWVESPLTLAQLARFSGHDFADYLTTLLKRQDQVYGEIHKRSLPLKLLPWLFTDNIAEKIRALSTPLEAV